MMNFEPHGNGYLRIHGENKMREWVEGVK